MAIRCASAISTAHTGIEYFEEPYRHLVIDNFFEESFAEDCLSMFPRPADPCWEWPTTLTSKLSYVPRGFRNSTFLRRLLRRSSVLNSSLILGAISERFCIPKLIPDPYFTGGGLNVTLPGGLLDVHVDGNYHDATGLNRRINAIVYLNPSGIREWGGEFGVYDAHRQRVRQAGGAHLQRLVVFDSHDFSFHGLPEPLAFPKAK